MVELASMIADEEFSDRPDCVCPVIGAFLRGWNDRAPHAERQRLAPYAARIVGSRSGRRATRERRDICLEWAGADLTTGRARRRLGLARMRLRIALYCGLAPAVRLNDGAGEYASRIARARGDAQGVFELLEAMLAVGEHGSDGRPPITVNGNGLAPRTDNGRTPIESTNGRSANGHGSTLNGAAPHEDSPAHMGERAEPARLD